MKQREEQRRVRRTAIRDAFSIFLTIPVLRGMSRIYIRDISTMGLNFFIDIDEFTKSCSVGQVLEIHLYMAPSFYFSLKGKIVRIENDNMAMEFERDQKSLEALSRFLSFLDAAVESAVFEGGTT